MMGYQIEGLAELLAREAVPVHAHRDEAACRPGHRPRQPVTWSPTTAATGSRSAPSRSSCCTLPGTRRAASASWSTGMLVAGDTLFLEGCGRTDLPGSDPDAMYDSLQRLASLPDSTVVYPGHRYSVPSTATLAAVKEINMVFKPPTKEAWLSIFGR